jgi:hypothetical protein
MMVFGMFNEVQMDLIGGGCEFLKENGVLPNDGSEVFIENRFGLKHEEGLV